MINVGTHKFFQTKYFTIFPPFLPAFLLKKNLKNFKTHFISNVVYDNIFHL